MDFISDLPEQIIHHIFTFLPDVDLQRLVILSKRFRSYLHSFPVITLASPCRHTSKLPVFLFSLNHPVRPFKVLRLENFNFELVDIKQLLRSPLLEDLSIKQCFLPHIEACCPNLKRFKFEDVGTSSPIEIDAPKLESLDVAGTCHSLKLNMRPCTALKELSLSNIKYIGRLENYIGIPTIEKLRLLNVGLEDGAAFKSYVLYPHCPRIKSLELIEMCIPYQWINDHISKFTALEILKIRQCRSLHHFNIVSSSLKLVEIEDPIPNKPMFGTLGIDTLRIESLLDRIPKKLMLIDTPRLESLVLNDCNRYIASAADLKSLSLGMVCIESRWFNDHVGRFPLLEILRLVCWNYDKISLHFTTSSEDTITLHSNFYPGMCCHRPKAPPRVHIHARSLSTTYADVRTLKLNEVCTENGHFYEILPKLVSLQDLTMAGSKTVECFRITHQGLRSLKLIHCKKLEEITISLPQLESLYIHECWELAFADIDTPKLSSFTYKGHVFAPGHVNYPRSLHANLILHRKNVGLIFCDLVRIDLLQAFNQCSLIVDYVK